jgi:hypothetical protein
MFKVEEMSACDLKGPAASIFGVEEMGTTISEIWCFLLQGRKDVFEYFRNPTASIFRVEERCTNVLRTYCLHLQGGREGGQHFRKGNSSAL